MTDDASFQGDLDADSLDLVELIMELEDQFGLKISDEDAQKIATVGAGRRLRHQPTADPAEAPESLRALIDRLPEPLRLLVFTHASWVSGARTPTSGWSSSATACWGSRSPTTCTSAFPSTPEGDLAKVRAHVVSRQSCATVAPDLGLDRDLRARGRELGTAPVEIDVPDRVTGRPGRHRRGGRRRRLPAVRPRRRRRGGRRARSPSRIEYALPSTSTTRRCCRRSLHVGAPR